MADKIHQGGPRGPAMETGANLALTALAEFVGTFLLVLVGTAVATVATLGKNMAGPAYDSLAIALSFGLILIPIVGYGIHASSGGRKTPSPCGRGLGEGTARVVLTRLTPPPGPLPQREGEFFYDFRLQGRL